MTDNLPILPRRLRDRCRELEKPRHRVEYREFLLEGVRIVEEALAAGAPILYAVVTAAFLERFPEAIEKIEGHGVPLYRAPEKDLRFLSQTVHSQGIVAVSRIPDETAAGYDLIFGGGGVVPLFDTIADPGNLGTAVRACDWFGVKGLLLSAGSVDIYNPKAVRATMGSIFRVRCIPFDDFAAVADAAKRFGYRICAAEADAPPVAASDWHDGKVLLIFGSEAHGVSPEYRAHVQRSFSIPRFGEAESLNVSVACAILLSHYRMAAGWEGRG